ncbi:MAG: IS481 family transposase [Chloroflexota bacterium]|nr:IS481 family transposase [Chloroflexota bacterium]
MYQSARTTPLSRAFLLAEADRIGVSRAARNMGVSRNTVYRWRRRAGDFADRSCRPQRSPRRTTPEREAALIAARLEWRWGPDRIGPLCGIPRRTAYRILRRFGMHRLRSLFPAARWGQGTFQPLEPGELVQIDIKSLGSLARGGGRHKVAQRQRERERIGWQHAHVAIDGASRLSYIELRSGLGATDCAAFLGRAVAHFDARGIRVRRVLTDNGAGYKRIFEAACHQLGVRWTRTQPYHPWTNGRAERLIRTLQRECIYGGERFTTDEERRYAIARWLAFYNSGRPHTALDGLSPERWLRARGVTWV